MESVSTWLYDLMGSLSNMTLGFVSEGEIDVEADNEENSFEILEAEEFEPQSSPNEGLVNTSQPTEEEQASGQQSCEDQDDDDDDDEEEIDEEIDPDASSSVLASAKPTPQQLEENGKRIRQLLVLLLNAQKCQHRENQVTGEVEQCSQPHCGTLKNVLEHMTTCQAGKSCRVPHCSSSTQVLTHWRNCVRADCPVCLPVKQANEKTAATACEPSTKEAGKKTVCGRRPFNVGYYGNINGPLRCGKPPSSSVSVAVATEQEMDVDWHQCVTPELRKHLVNKLVQAMITSGPDKLMEPQMSTLFASMQKVESELYEMANSQYEYSILLAERVEKMQEQLKSTQIGG